MKKTIILVLALLLILSGCVSRVTVEDKEDIPEDPIITEEPVKEEPTKTEHILEDAEEISEIISIVAGLLNKAEDCSLLYTGKIAVIENEQQNIEDANYMLTDSKFLSIEDIEAQWLNTFIPDGKAKQYYAEMIEDKRYVSINGQLYVKEYQEDLPPMTMGKWEIGSITIKSVSDDKILVEMKTTLVGQGNGVKELEIIKTEDSWLLTDSYFLD